MADEQHDDTAEHEPSLSKANPGDERHTAIMALVTGMEAVLVGNGDPKDAPPMVDCYNAICVLIARACCQSGDPDHTFALIGKMAMHNMDALLDADDAEAAKRKLN